MSDMFNSFYDDIFLPKDSDGIENNKIDLAERVLIESGVPVEEKRYFAKLKTEYLKIKGIKDYQKIQIRLYENKSKIEIIKFEIARIKNHSKCNAKIFAQIDDINSLLKIYNDNIPEQKYYKIINLIIKMEIQMGMRIGLFKELCDLFEAEVKRINEGNVTKKSFRILKKKQMENGL